MSNEQVNEPLSLGCEDIKVVSRQNFDMTSLSLGTDGQHHKCYCQSPQGPLHVYCGELEATLKETRHGGGPEDFSRHFQ
jgi:hypothetical protein